MTIKEVANILTDFSKKHNLKQEARDACRISITNYLIDEPDGLGGLTLDDVRLEFIKQELIFEHYFYQQPFIKTRMGIYKPEEDDAYVRNLEPLGYYELDTDMNGKAFDDWLIID